MRRRTALFALVALLTTTVPAVGVSAASNLTAGSRGAEVVQLQNALAAKGFFRGPADGVYGSKTAQAVMAFRKEIGVTRSFSWSASHWSQLTSYPGPWTPVRVGERDRVEVNLTRQVMYLFRNGTLRGIFPISSGNGEPYRNSYGSFTNADTPVGDFRVQRHIVGVRESYLGTLYNPWYFTGGYALHGSASVPASPASHGCVRLTMWDSEWLESQLYIGIPVHIWYEPPGVGPGVGGPPIEIGGPPPCPDGVLCDTVAFHDSQGRFHLWDRIAQERTASIFYYGNPGDVAFSGDWNGDGVATPGLYRRSDGFVYLRNSNTQGIADIAFFFGNPGDIPLAGDFDGDGLDTVSIFRPSENRVYVINRLGANGGGLGAADSSFSFGNPGDQPFVGDFDGDGIDTVGMFRSASATVYLKNSNGAGSADVAFPIGIPGDRALAGDWNGDGVDTVALFRPSVGVLFVTNGGGSAVESTYLAGRFVGVVPMSR